MCDIFNETFLAFKVITWRPRRIYGRYLSFRLLPRRKMNHGGHRREICSEEKSLTWLQFVVEHSLSLHYSIVMVRNFIFLV